MKKFNELAVICLFNLVLIGCSAEKPGSTQDGATPAASTDSTGSEKVIDAAEAAYEKADTMGAAWRDTQSMIKSAKDALNGNDPASAKDLAEQALEQSQMAMKQFDEQKNAGPTLF